LRRRVIELKEAADHRGSLAVTPKSESLVTLAQLLSRDFEQLRRHQSRCARHHVSLSMRDKCQVARLDETARSAADFQDALPAGDDMEHEAILKRRKG